MSRSPRPCGGRRDGKPLYRSKVSIPKAVEKPDPKLFDKPDERP